MRVRSQLTLTSVSLVLIPGLLLGGLCAFLMVRQSTISARMVGEGLAHDTEAALTLGVQRERDFVQGFISQAAIAATNLAVSSQVPVALGAVDPASSAVMQEALAAIDRAALDTVVQFQAQANILQRLLERNLQLASLMLVKSGVPRCGAAVERQIVNQTTKATSPVAVPALFFGDHELPWNEVQDTPSPIVDDVAQQTEGLCTIFVLAGDGSMVRSATNVLRGKQRAIGTCIPALEPDGKPGPVLSAVMAGTTYRGLAKVVDQWCLTAYLPLRSADGTIIGMLFVGVRINDTPTLADTVLRRTFGKTGYAFVLDASGCFVIHPRKDMVGKHIVDDFKLTALAPALGPATPGMVARIDYLFEDRSKFASWTRMPGWNWTFIASGYTEEIASGFSAAALAAHRTEIDISYRGSFTGVDGQQRALFSQVSLLDAAGKELAGLQHGKPMEKLHDDAATAWFKAAQAHQDGGVYIHPLEAAADTGATGMRLVAPIVVTGKRLGYSVINLDWSVVSDRLTAHRYGSTGYPWILDANGTIVTHPRFSLKDAEKATDSTYGELASVVRNRMLTGETGIVRCTVQGSDTYCAFAPLAIGSTRYCLATSVPAAEMLILANRLDTDGKATAATSTTILASIVILVTLVGAGIGIWLARRLTRPLAATEAVLAKVANGDLTARLGITSDDEYGRMSAALDQAMSAMAMSTRAVIERARAVGTQATNLTRIGKDLSQNAASTDAQATATASSAQEVAHAAASLALAVQEMESTIQEIARGGQIAVQTASEAVSAADGASTGMEQLRATSTEIGSIIKTITGIAEQVNLLALNATIEAARAGDAGRGFAVVASEVKDLARRVQQASADISTRINSIQSQVGASASAMTQISGFIKRLDELQQTSATAVEEQAATAKEMARSVQNTAEAAQSIASSVDAVVQSSRTTTAAATEANQAASELQGIASGLDASVARFTT